MFSFIQSANMSLKVIKAGLLDTIQDMGRIGYQHLGINPSGAMDRFAAQTANMLMGNLMKDLKGKADGTLVKSVVEELLP